MSKILVPLAQGFEEIEAVNIIDICRRADISVITAGINDIKVTGAHNISIIADTVVDQVKASDFDMIVLPGGWGGTYILAENPKVQSLLKTMKQDDKYIGAICAAPYALNQAGVLSDEFTCYPSVENKIRLDGYRDDLATVTQNKVITSRGVGTASLFALEIVKTLKGEQVFKKLKKAILL